MSFSSDYVTKQIEIVKGANSVLYGTNAISAVIDIRTKPEWEETGIVPGSKLLTFFDERGKADPAAWLDKVKPLAGPNDPVIVICRSGNRTKAVSQFLSQQAGYAKVYNVKSGIKGWIADKGAIVPATQSIAACQAAKTC
mgnify:CR=1 FL=1